MSLNREFNGEIEEDLFRACLLLPESCRMESEDGFLFSCPMVFRRVSKKSPGGKSSVLVNWKDRVEDAKEVARVITKVVFSLGIPIFSMGRQRVAAYGHDDENSYFKFSLIGNNDPFNNEVYVEMTFKKGPAPTN